MARRGVGLLDELQLRLLPAPRGQRFFVATAMHNAAPFIERSLSSVHRQRYERAQVHHLVIDDASTDDSVARVGRWQKQHPDHPLELWRNGERAGGCANYTRAFRQAPPDSIVLQVDGDDWLADDYVIPYLSRVYHDPEVWMTYNTWRFPDGRSSLNSVAIPREITERNAVREYPWISSHLHSFRARLFAHVREDSLIDPDTNAHWSSAVDLAHYLPMLELAGRRARHLARVSYVYNLHDQSVFTSNRAEQAACERRIRRLPRYRPLATLS